MRPRDEVARGMSPAIMAIRWAEISGRIGAACALLSQGRYDEAKRFLRAMRQTIEPPLAHHTNGEVHQLELPLRLWPETQVDDCPLHCTITAGTCVARQEENERLAGNGGSRKKRGTVVLYPTCTTDCPIGRKVRIQLRGKLP